MYSFCFLLFRDFYQSSRVTCHGRLCLSSWKKWFHMSVLHRMTPVTKCEWVTEWLLQIDMTYAADWPILQQIVGHHRLCILPTTNCRPKSSQLCGSLCRPVLFFVKRPRFCRNIFENHKNVSLTRIVHNGGECTEMSVLDTMETTAKNWNYDIFHITFA